MVDHNHITIISLLIPGQSCPACIDHSHDKDTARRDSAARLVEMKKMQHLDLPPHTIRIKKCAPLIAAGSLRITSPSTPNAPHIKPHALIPTHDNRGEDLFSTQNPRWSRRNLPCAPQPNAASCLARHRRRRREQ